jgi:D-aminopeptidase
VSGRALDEIFEAVVDAAEESVLNSMLTAPTTVGRDGNTSVGLDADDLLRVMGEHRARH